MERRASSEPLRLAGTGSVRSALRWLNPLPRLVHLLSSIRLAMVLILAIAGVVLVGTVVDQVPQPMRGNPTAYAAWVESERAKYGSWTDLLHRLDLFNVFQSTLFRGLIGLLAVSILVCTLRRWRSVWNLTFHTRVRVTEAFLTHTKFHEQFEATASPEATA